MSKPQGNMIDILESFNLRYFKNFGEKIFFTHCQLHSDFGSDKHDVFDPRQAQLMTNAKNNLLPTKVQECENFPLATLVPPLTTEDSEKNHNNVAFWKRY